MHAIFRFSLLSLGRLHFCIKCPPIRFVFLCGLHFHCCLIVCVYSPALTMYAIPMHKQMLHETNITATKISSLFLLRMETEAQPETVNDLRRRRTPVELRQLEKDIEENNDFLERLKIDLQSKREVVRGLMKVLQHAEQKDVEKNLGCHGRLTLQLRINLEVVRGVEEALQMEREMAQMQQQKYDLVKTVHERWLARKVR